MKATRRALLLLLLAAGAAPAAGPRWGGLAAVAVSPDGKLLAAGGANRVVYLLDAESLAVKSRFWLGTRVGRLAFSKDGARLLVEDDADAVHLLDPKTGKAVVTVPRCGGASAAPAAGVFAVRDRAYYPGTALRVLALKDGKESARLELKQAASAFALSADGKRLVVLTEGVEGDERRVPLRDIPEKLTGLAREEYRLKNDGQVAWLRTFEVGTGKVLRDLKLWYTSDADSTELIWAGDDVLVVNFGNVCARVGPKGATALFETGVLFNYGVGATADGKALLAGGLRGGTLGAPGGKRVRFEVDALGGRDEYFAAFAARPDGGAYGVTSACRLARVTREGKVAKVVPVY